MDELTLVIMAAGMGKRFGGLKQIEPVDEDGNFIIDYSVYDAIKAGFTKVVFVITKELYADFKETIGKRLEGKIKVCYAFQEKEDIPFEKKELLKERVKPWGTVQAIYASKPYVTGSFAVINADDFYGYDSYAQIAKFLKENKKEYEYVSIPYPFGVTASKKGAVKRGYCEIKDGYIKKIVECSMEIKDDKVIAQPLSGEEAFTIDKNTLVSMNIFGFKHSLYTLLEDYLNTFFKQDIETILKSEALLPSCLEENLQNGTITLACRPTSGKWLGMTYKSDLEFVKEQLKELQKNNEYPQHLWK